MQWLKLVSEDGGTQSLKADNRLPARTPSVDAVSPYPASHPARIGERREAPAAPIKDRRQGERRKGERRQKQEAVLLDTRSKHDRRAIENRRESAASSQSTPARRPRINLYA
jgi:hypothetical protein